MQLNTLKVCLLLTATFFVGCVTTRTVPINLPDQTLTSADDAEFELSSLRGSVVLLDFWATWCKPCRFALPAYAKLYEKYGDSGLKVIAISVDHDATALTHYLRKNPVPFTILKDPKGRLAQQMGVTKMPTTFLIDREGKIEVFFPGFGTSMLERLKQHLAGMLSEKQ